MNTMQGSPQLTLGIQLRDTASFDNFYVSADNETVKYYLENFLLQAEDKVAYIWSLPQQGRTHLLQACCHLANLKNLTAVYLPLQNIAQLTPEVFQGLEHCDLICLDDIDRIAAQREWEEALFHLYNRLQDTQHHLLVSANCAPHELAFKLPDLISRLSAATIFHLQSLSETEKLLALQLRAQHRGIQLPANVGQFLLHHWPRNNSDLFTALEKLDQASLAAKRTITVPFLKEVLGL